MASKTNSSGSSNGKDDGSASRRDLRKVTEESTGLASSSEGGSDDALKSLEGTEDGATSTPTSKDKPKTRLAS